jgi:hypothetical protein
MPCRTQPHQPDSSPPPSSSTRRPHLTLEGGILGASGGSPLAIHPIRYCRRAPPNSNTLGAGCKVAQEPGHLPGIVQPVLGGKLTPANKATRTADEAVRLLSGSGVMGSGLVVNRPREAESLGVGASSTCWAGAESRASVTATGQVWTYAACLMPQTSCHA